MNKPTAYISKLVFSDKSFFEFQQMDKIIIVGPNNSGKSQTLREVISISKSPNKPEAKVLNDIDIFKQGTLDELKEFLTSCGEINDRHYQYKNWTISFDHCSYWNQPNLCGQLNSGYLKLIDANERLSICKQQESLGPNQRKSKPQHVLYDSDENMELISNLFKRAFGNDLMFDYHGGSKLPIHVGEKPKSEGVVDRVGDWYVGEIRKNPLLDEQGDGMKAYAGILFETVVGDLDIILIDEPEAFLHPPQMRKLGETLASEVKGQLFVATHSSDILRGFLEGTKGNVRILRIRRDNDVNIVNEASPEVIQELWQKPDLRYSNALEGIFHDQTIICEDDSDCRLFNSVADHLAALSTEKWLDTAYVPAGGKHGIPKIAEILRKIGVPVKAIFDIDFLSEEDLVKKTVEAFGGDWSTIQILWKRLDAAVTSGIPPKSPTQIKTSIKSIIDTSEEHHLPKSQIRDALKQTTSWNMVKQVGKAAIPNGDAQKTYNDLISTLESISIFIVPAGEVENFCPEIGKHGPSYVTKLLQDYNLGDTKLEDLRVFTERVHIFCPVIQVSETEHHADQPSNQSDTDEPKPTIPNPPPPSNEP